eukprot:393602-Pelagomonas_calceolata.AAC.1
MLLHSDCYQHVPSNASNFTEALRLRLKNNALGLRASWHEQTVCFRGATNCKQCIALLDGKNTSSQEQQSEISKNSFTHMVVAMVAMVVMHGAGKGAGGSLQASRFAAKLE